jgi:uncharacterized protein
MVATPAQHETDTVGAARADARAQAGRVAEAMPYLPASSTPFPPPGVDADLLVSAEMVAAGGYTHKVLARGSRIRLEDVTGEACAHVLLYNAVEPWERLNVADTMKIPWQAYLGTGHPLLSGEGRVLATVVADDAGRHDALGGTSTAAANRVKYGGSAPQGPSPSGRELFILAAAKHGLTPRDLPPSISFFKGCASGQTAGVPGTISWSGNAYVRTGTVLRSNYGNALATVVANEIDRRGTIGGACGKESNTLRYGYHTMAEHGCRENFLAEAGEVRHGRPRHRVQPQLVHERPDRG